MARAVFLLRMKVSSSQLENGYFHFGSVRETGPLSCDSLRQVPLGHGVSFQFGVCTNTQSNFFKLLREISRSFPAIPTWLRKDGDFKALTWSCSSAITFDSAGIRFLEADSFGIL